MRRSTRTAAGILIVITLAVAVGAPARSDAAAKFTVCGTIDEKDHCVEVPRVTEVTVGEPGSVAVGDQVLIQCQLGGASFIVYHPTDPKDKFWHQNGEKPFPLLPFEIRVDGVTLVKKEKHFSGTWDVEKATWVPQKAQAGKTVLVECIIDPNTVFYKSKREKVKSVKALLIDMLPAPPPRAAPKAGSAPPVVKAGQPQFPTLPDITSGTGVTIGGKSAPWGSSVAVDVKDAHSVNMNNSGLCQFGIKHTARNIGLASTGGFDSEWKNSNVPGSGAGRFWLPIEPGGSKEETDLLTLKPGQNLLHLRLDSQEKVQESNENNNRFRVIVNVNGSCGPKPGIVPPPGGGAQPGPPASPQLPAVRQKSN